MRSLDFVEKETQRRDLPPFRVGDAVRVHVRVKEGDKERIQIFEGLVIRRRGAGNGETFTVRKVASGVGVERIFPVQSRLVTKVEIKSRGYVRRSRLYYLRDLTGKKARLQSKVRDLSELVSLEEVDQRDVVDDVVDDEVVAAPEAEASPETVETSAETSALRGKARKRAKAREKVGRMKELSTSEAKRAAAKEAKEAKEAKRAAEEAAAAEAPADETKEGSDG
ncbi:MAG TPA: 50S ribosomal protein L19 [Myxococcales bacterium]|nr:50S ribosomal protein L19 [Myxococcales bacterium]